jgi:hypothetical protein
MATTKGHSQVFGTATSYVEDFSRFPQLLKANVGTVPPLPFVLVILYLKHHH